MASLDILVPKGDYIGHYQPQSGQLWISSFVKGAMIIVFLSWGSVTKAQVAAHTAVEQRN